MALETTTIGEVLAHLQEHDTPLRVPRVGPLVWDDVALHEAAHAEDPVLYALLGLAPDVRPWQRARVLLQTLRASWVGLTTGDREVVRRVVGVLMLALPAERVLTVLLALRRLRVNHKHVTRAMAWFVLDHPQADSLARQRRPALVDCLEHAVGRDVARACAWMLADPAANTRYARRHLLRFAGNPEAAAGRVRELYGPAPEVSDDGHEALPPLISLDEARERPATVTATNRGDVAAAIYHIYRGGPSIELEREAERHLGALVADLPRFAGKVALVLDASASTRSYGDREYASLSQAVAFRLLLERCCDHLRVVTVGGEGAIPRPEGPTDLAVALLDALESKPDLVAIVSDGYENVLPGDLSRVVATLPQIGIQTPVAFCHSAFTGSDDLTLRRPAPALPEHVFWHQSDLVPLVTWLLTQTPATSSGPWLRAMLLRRLAATERSMEGRAR